MVILKNRAQAQRKTIIQAIGEDFIIEPVLETTLFCRFFNSPVARHERSDRTADGCRSGGGNDV